MIDVTETINAVQRQVGARMLEAGEARTTTISRIYDAGVEELWDACTNPERIPRGSCRCPASCASAAGTSWRATPAG